MLHRSSAFVVFGWICLGSVGCTAPESREDHGSSPGATASGSSGSATTDGNSATTSDETIGTSIPDPSEGEDEGSIKFDHYVADESGGEEEGTLDAVNAA